MENNTNKVIVKRSGVPFTSGCEDAIEKIYNEYNNWIIDNIGYTAEYNRSYTLIEETIYFEFIFNTQEDATTFKLRWL